MRKEHAFTIIELMVTLALAATLLTLGIPAMQDMLRNNRLASQTNNLVSDIQLARSEAIKRNTQIKICRTNDLDNDPTCLQPPTATGVWTHGWLVMDGANLVRMGYGPPGAAIDCSGPTTKWSICSTADEITFQADGTLIGDTVRIAVCDGRPTRGRQLDISPMGRPKLYRAGTDVKPEQPPPDPPEISHIDCDSPCDLSLAACPPAL